MSVVGVVGGVNRPFREEGLHKEGDTDEEFFILLLKSCTEQICVVKLAQPQVGQQFESYFS